MSEQLELNGSREKVAFKMASAISTVETAKDKSIVNGDFRTHFLTLYRQCHKATSGFSLEEVLKKD